MARLGRERAAAVIAIFGAWAGVGGTRGCSPAQGAPVVSATAEIEVAGGHDDNMFLSASPDGLGMLARTGGAYASLTPALGAELATGELRLRLAYFGDFRAADAVGRLDTHVLDLRAWLPAWGPLRAHVALFGGAFAATQFPADQYLFGGAELGLRLALADRFGALLGVRTELRALAADATGNRQKDWLLAPQLRLPWQVAAGWEIAPVLSAVLVVPLTDGAGDQFRRVRAGLDASAALGILTVTGASWAGPVTLGDVAETDAGGRFETRVDVGGGIQLFALAEIVAQISSGASDHYARRLFSLGIAGRLQIRRSAQPVSPAADLRPQVRAGQVRFRIADKQAVSVTVVGSWNDWAAPGVPLVAEGQGGVWELLQRLPRGSHRYHFVVDGQARRPPEAPRYVPDQFGSEDGVVDIDGDSDPAGGATP